MMPLRTSTLVRFSARMFSFALEIISSVMSTPITRPLGPTFLAARSRSIPAPDPKSSTTSPGLRPLNATGLPQPKESTTADSGKEATSSPV